MDMSFFGGEDTFPIWEQLLWWSILAGGWDNPLVYALDLQVQILGP